MTVKALVIFLSAIVAVSASIDLSPYEKERIINRATASYADILKASHLIDFNLNQDEKYILNMFLAQNANTTMSDVTIKNVHKFNDELFKIIESVKLPENGEPVQSPTLNSMFLLLNYDLMAQILDPKYNKTSISIPIEKGHRELKNLEKNILNMISDRWRPKFTGGGINWTVPKGLENFYTGTEEEVAQGKQQVYKMYLELDDFVLRTLSDSFSKYYNNRFIGRPTY